MPVLKVSKSDLKRDAQETWATIHEQSQRTATMRPLNNQDRREWVKVRLYICSSFKDFHYERSIIESTVYPRLKEWCEERCVELVLVDLKSDINEMIAAESCLSTCFHEIDEASAANGHPYFLCFLGVNSSARDTTRIAGLKRNPIYIDISTSAVVIVSERLGWVPKEQELNDTLRNRYGWIDGLSLVEMEVLHGAYRQGNENALFLLRKKDMVAKIPLPYRADFSETNSASTYRLNELKARIPERFRRDQYYIYSGKYSDVDPTTSTVRWRLSEKFLETIMQFFKARVEGQYGQCGLRPTLDAMDGDMNAWLDNTELTEDVTRRHSFDKMLSFANQPNTNSILVVKYDSLDEPLIRQCCHQLSLLAQPHVFVNVSLVSWQFARCSLLLRRLHRFLKLKKRGFMEELRDEKLMADDIRESLSDDSVAQDVLLILGLAEEMDTNTWLCALPTNCRKSCRIIIFCAKPISLPSRYRKTVIELEPSAHSPSVISDLPPACQCALAVLSLCTTGLTETQLRTVLGTPRLAELFLGKDTTNGHHLALGNVEFDEYSARVNSYRWVEVVNSLKASARICRTANHGLLYQSRWASRAEFTQNESTSHLVIPLSYVLAKFAAVQKCNERIMEERCNLLYRAKNYKELGRWTLRYHVFKALYGEHGLLFVNSVWDKICHSTSFSDAVTSCIEGDWKFSGPGAEVFQYCTYLLHLCLRRHQFQIAETVIALGEQQRSVETVDQADLVSWHWLQARLTQLSVLSANCFLYKLYYNEAAKMFYHLEECLKLVDDLKPDDQRLFSLRLHTALWYHQCKELLSPDAPESAAALTRAEELCALIHTQASTKLERSKLLLLKATLAQPDAKDAMQYIKDAQSALPSNEGPAKQALIQHLHFEACLLERTLKMKQARRVWQKRHALILDGNDMDLELIHASEAILMEPVYAIGSGDEDTPSPDRRRKGPVLRPRKPASREASLEPIAESKDSDASSKQIDKVTIQSDTEKVIDK